MCRQCEDGKSRWGKVVCDGHVLDTPDLASSHLKGQREDTFLFAPSAQASLRSEALPYLMEYVVLEALRDVSAA